MSRTFHKIQIYFNLVHPTGLPNTVAVEAYEVGILTLKVTGEALAWPAKLIQQTGQSMEMLFH
jgi:hypothetical protein